MSVNTSFSKVIPEDKVPLPPPDAKVFPTACDYCIVGCGYKVYRWPVGQEGGPKAHENAFGVNYPTAILSGKWPTPNQHNIVFADGRPHHIIVIPDGDIPVVNKGGNHSIRGGNICQKVYSPYKATADRLKTPLLRVRNTLQPISWDDAIRITAEVGRHVIDTYGELAWGMKTYSYQFFENTYAITKLALVAVETPCWAHHDKPSAMADATGLEDIGIDSFGPSYEDYALAEVLLISGTDPYETKTVLFTEWIMKGKAKVIMVLPRKSTGVAYAERTGGLFLQIIPGTDTVLHNALCRVILEKGWEDREFIKKWIASDEEINWGMGRGPRNTPWQWRTTRWGRSFGKFKEWVLNDPHSTLDYAEKTTGIPREKILRAAEMIAKPREDGARPKASFMVEKGCYWSNNYLNTISFANLGLLCGAGTRPGQVIGRGGGHQRGMIQAGPYPITKSPEKFGLIGRKQMDLDRWVLAGHIRFMWVLGTQWFNAMMASQFLMDYVRKNTIASPHQIGSFSPDQAVEVLKARADSGGMVLVEQDIYPRDISQLADLILPAATWGEADFTRAQGERRLRIYSKFYDPPGEAKPDWWIIGQVAKRMGYEGFDWRESNDVFEEAARFSRNGTLDYAALVEKAKGTGKKAHELLRELGTTGIQCPIRLEDGKLVGTKRLHDETAKYPTPKGVTSPLQTLTKFGKTSGKAILHIADWNFFKDFHERITPKGDELWVTNGRVNEIWQSLFDDLRKPYITQRYPMNFIEINPEDARSRKIENGDHVSVENDDVLVQTGGFYGVASGDLFFTNLLRSGYIERTKGAVTAMAIVTDAVPPGVTFMYFLWPGSPANSLVHNVPDPISNAPRYKLGKGRIRKIGETPAKKILTFAPKHNV